jgi:hypothetical protein
MPFQEFENLLERCNKTGGQACCYPFQSLTLQPLGGGRQAHTRLTLTHINPVSPLIAHH